MQVIFLLNQIVSKVMLVALFKMYVSCFMCNLMRKQIHLWILLCCSKEPIKCKHFAAQFMRINIIFYVFIPPKHVYLRTYDGRRLRDANPKCEYVNVTRLKENNHFAIISTKYAGHTQPQKFALPGQNRSPQLVLINIS